MLYTSTRDKSVRVTSAEAITQGISVEGGLFVPEEIPSIDKDFIDSLVSLDYISRAKKVLSLYLTDFTAEEIDYCVSGAYAKGKFSSEKVAPVVTTKGGKHILELWHGPTCAFKDMALQLLPYLLTTSAKKTGTDKTIVILVATSGDTGKAALEGFKDVPGTKIMVFYPDDGVSPMQKLQMTTQPGGNVCVSAIYGNFDDAQNGVKAIFTDNGVKAKLAQNNMMFSSANSINWGRLVPQIVYYISAYCDLIEGGIIKNGDEINVTVPTGNFGNILAAYYAKKMGLPIKRLICASNMNNVLTDFLKTGTYDRNRKFYTTTSPSMDILISSNLERLLYHVTDGNAIAVSEWMGKLVSEGEYKIDGATFEKIAADFSADYSSETDVKGVVYAEFSEGYLLDTHTAVAVKAADCYTAETGDLLPNVIASTANPYKFSAAVLASVKGEVPADLDEFEQVAELKKVTGVECPPQLENLKGAEIRFSDCCKKEDMIKKVYEMLGI